MSWKRPWPGRAARLAEPHRNLAGIEDSCGELEKSVAFRRAAGRRQVFVGNDYLALELLERGLDGSVTGGADPVAELVVEIARRHAWGDAAGRALTCALSGAAPVR